MTEKEVQLELKEQKMSDLENDKLRDAYQLQCIVSIKLNVKAAILADALRGCILMHEDFGCRIKGSTYDWAYGKLTTDKAKAALKNYEVVDE